MGKPNARMQELLQARKKAHSVFDQIWRERFMSRDKAYVWLSEQTGLAEEDCHFRVFDVGMCGAIEVLAQRKLKALKRIRARQKKVQKQTLKK